MATRLILANLDLNGNELQNVLIHKLAADPSGGSLHEGLFWYNTTTHRLKWYDGTSVRDITDAATLNGQAASFYLSRANHTGTQTASTISDFDSQVRTSRLDQLAAPTADVSMNSHKVTNVTDPGSAQDAATKGYVDSVAQGGVYWKQPVRVAVGSNVTISNPGTSSFDGVTLSTGDRLLLYGQSTGSENGVYVFNGSSSALTRATDADTSAEVKSGLAVFVDEGTLSADTAWTLTTNDPITLGTTSLTFVQFSGLGQVTSGAGLTKTGNTLDVGAGTGISVAADSVGIDTSVVVRKFMTSVGDGSSTSITVTHNLGTKDVSVTVYDNSSPFEEVYPEVDHATTNTVTLIFTTAPTSNQYRCVVHG